MMKGACVSGGSSFMAGEPDRLSALPDCLLHTIMSFMKARQVVQTCVLSTRWRRLWCSTPCLDIDIDEFNTGTGFSYMDMAHNDWEVFEDFALNLMLRSNIAVLDSFRLNVYSTKAPYFGNQLAASWLRRAMKYRTQSHSTQLAESSNSWRLKRMHLRNIFLDNRFAKHVSSVCHSLEHFELNDCTCQIYAITSDSLKNLVLKNCCCFKLCHIRSATLKSLVIDGGSGASDECLVITTPLVAYLHLAVDVGYFYAGISINEMPSLDKASIILLGNRGGTIDSKLGNDQVKLLGSVSPAATLELSNLRTMVFNEESTTFQQFKNLRNLLLQNCDVSDDFQTLALFLENSPNLEKLTLRQCTISNGSKKSSLPSQFRNLSVLRANLKLTEIIYKEDVCQLVGHFLRNSGNLPNNQFEFRKVV